MLKFIKSLFKPIKPIPGRMLDVSNSKQSIWAHKQSKNKWTKHTVLTSPDSYIYEDTKTVRITPVD